MGTFTDFDQAVLEMVTEYGTTGTYTKVSGSTYNPTTGSVTSSTTSFPIKVYLHDLTLQSNGYSYKYGTQVQAGDKEAECVPPIKTGGQAMTIDPVNDKLTVAGVSYSIVTFKEVNLTGDNPILYSFYLRR